MVSNAGGKMLYEEQTNVTEDGWQQFLPAWCHAHLSSQPEVESTSPPLESGPACKTCFYQWHTAEVTMPVPGQALRSQVASGFALLEASGHAVEKVWLEHKVRTGRQ